MKKQKKQSMFSIAKKIKEDRASQLNNAIYGTYPQPQKKKKKD